MTTQRSNQKNASSRVLIPIFCILLVIILGLSFVKAYFSNNPRSFETFSVETGTVLPDFQLTKIDGTSLPISKLPGKVFLVNFWATWCEACMIEMPSIVSLRERFKNEGLEVIGINLDENPVAVVPRAITEFKIEFPVFKDPEGKVAELFDVHAIPLTVVMDQNRTILYVKNGEMDWNSNAVRSKIEGWLRK